MLNISTDDKAYGIIPLVKAQKPYPMIVQMNRLIFILKDPEKKKIMGFKLSKALKLLLLNKISILLKGSFKKKLMIPVQIYSKLNSYENAVVMSTRRETLFVECQPK